MARRDIEAGRAFVRLGLKNELKRKLGTALKSAGVAVAAFSVAAAAGAAVAGAALAKSIKSFADYGDQIHKATIRTGFAAEALSELDFAAERSGASFADLETGLRGMARFLLNAERGLTTSTDTLTDLGLTIEGLNRLSPDERFSAFAEAVSKIPDPTRRAGLAMQVFGRAGTALLPLLAEGASGIAELREEANRLGITMSTEDAEAAAEFTDAMTDLKTAIKGASQDIAASVLGNGDLAEGIKDIATRIAEIDWAGYAKEGVDAFNDITGGVEGLTTALKNVKDFLIDVRVGFMRVELLARQAQSSGQLQMGSSSENRINLSDPQKMKENRLRQAELLAEIESLSRESAPESAIAAARRLAPGLIESPGEDKFTIDLSGKGGPSDVFGDAFDISDAELRATRLMMGGAIEDSITETAKQPGGGLSGVSFSAAAAQAGAFGGGDTLETKIMKDQLNEAQKLVREFQTLAAGMVHI